MSAANAHTPMMTLRRSVRSENRPSGSWASAPPTKDALMNRAIPVIDRPTSSANTTPSPPKAPFARPTKKPPTTPTGDMAYKRRSRRCTSRSGCGALDVVRPTGTSASAIAIAVSANRENPAGSPSGSTICPTVTALRLITMYTARTWPRLTLVARSLSQLSITMNKPAKQTPLSARSGIHTSGCTASAMSSTIDAAIAAHTANVRMWPTRRTMYGIHRQPTMKPAE